VSTATLSHDGFERSAGPSRLRLFAVLLARRVMRRLKIRSDRSLLQAMPDHMLKDIGIDRSEIERALNEGRWTKL
jgi:uncharacterized protein YjiS (DUF1127 family)